jgi:predicted nucleic acid-binding protein
LDLLPQVFPVVFAPPAVRRELGISVDWLTVKPVQNVAVVATLNTQVDAGEAEAIALAMELGDVMVILDDKKARRVAKQVGLRVIGTVGVLLRAKQQGVIDAVKPLLDALDAADFRIAEGLRREALRLAGEDLPTV